MVLLVNGDVLVRRPIRAIRGTPSRSTSEAILGPRARDLVRIRYVRTERASHRRFDENSSCPLRPGHSTKSRHSAISDPHNCEAAV